MKQLKHILISVLSTTENLANLYKRFHRHRFMWLTWGSHSDNHWYKMYDNGTDSNDKGAFWEYSFQINNVSMIGIYNPKDL